MKHRDVADDRETAQAHDGPRPVERDSAREPGARSPVHSSGLNPPWKRWVITEAAPRTACSKASASIHTGRLYPSGTISSPLTAS